MQDLVVCVGESCHLSGAEIVVKKFKELIGEKQLGDRIALKGSFCIGECTNKGDDEVSVRWGDRVFQVTPEECRHTFTREIWPASFAAKED